MNKFARNAFVGLFLLGASLSCSKSEDPAPTVGCEVTFKGIKVSLLDLICGTSLGYPSVNATNLPAEQELGLINGDAALQSISFVTSGDPDSYYSSTFSSSPPSITVSGKTWTFSGTLTNSTGDSGAISGTCTCAN